MSTEQANITAAIMQAAAEAARVVLQAMAVDGAENSTRHGETQKAGPNSWTHCYVRQWSVYF